MLGQAAERFAVLAERFADWAERNPGIIKAIGLLIGGIVGLRVAGAALGLMFGGPVGFAFKKAGAGLLWLAGRFIPLRWAMVAARYGIWALAKDLTRGLFRGVKGLGPLLMRGLRFPWAARMLAGLLPALARAKGAFAGLGRLLGPALMGGLRFLGPILLRGLSLAFGILSGPVGWAILAASAVGLMIRYRKELKAFWDERVVPWFGEAWQKVKDYVANINWRETALQVIEKIAYGLGFAWGKVQEWWSAAWKDLIAFVTGIDWGAVGKAVAFGIANGLTLGLAAKLTGITVGGILKNVMPAAKGTLDFYKEGSERRDSAFMRGYKDAQKGSKIPGRALGGSVSAGRMYEWNERGRELFVPGRSGTVIDAATVAALNRGGGRGGDVINNHFTINGATDPQAVARAVERYIRKAAAGQSALLSD